MDLRDRLRERIEAARRETFALYLACRDPRVPWYVRAMGAAVVAYALSPIDLIPDFIPVLGYLDDLVIIPAGVVLVRKMIPAPILAEHRAAAQTRLAAGGRSGWIAAGVVVVCWVAVVGVVVAVLVL